MNPTTYKTPHEISILGFEALVEKLGAGGALEFLSQYEKGRGDYTREREGILNDMPLDEIRKGMLGDTGKSDP